jgi:capsular polysaccharide biosynthesis protein
MLPRLYLLMVLRRFGADIPLALSTRLPDWAKSFARIFEPDAPVVWYDDSRQCVTAPCIVMPAMLHTEHNYHPAMNLMLQDLAQRHGAAAIGTPPTPRRICVAGQSVGENGLENEAEVEQLFIQLGFTVIQPHLLSIEQQIRVFSGARVIAGAYGSGLHNAIFAGRDTRVIAINFANDYQSKIGRLRGHRLAFVAPAGGGFRHWRLAPGLPHTFRVDLGVLRRTALDMTEDPD